MQSVTALLLLVAVSFLRGGAATEVVTLNYERSDHSSAPMDIKVDLEARTISYHMQDTEGFFGDANTLEDYETGYAASRVASPQEVCFLRRLTESMEKTIDRIHGLEEKGVQHIMGKAETWAEPLTNLEEVAGARLADFCGEAPVYKLVQPDSSIERKPMSQKHSSSTSMAEYLREGFDPETVKAASNRQTTVTFIKCWIFFFFPICFQTNITFNTGTTFLFFFFG